MRKFAIFIFIAVFVCTLTVGVFGAELSPAISVIRAERRVIKTCVLKNPIALLCSDIDNVSCSSAESIMISSLPNGEYGSLKLRGVDVIEGDTVYRSEISSLMFCPEGEHKAGEYASMRFFVDGGRTEYECRIYFVDALNFAPTAIDGKASGIAGVSVWAELSGSDPEGDELTYKITSYPKYGSVTLDTATGKLVYTADDGYIGSDSVSFVACDKYGNTSNEAKLKLVMRMNESGVVYSDMRDNSAHLAAVKLAEDGIMVGERIGDEMYFYPDADVCRMDLLVMAMRSAGLGVNFYDVSSTGFDDDDSLTFRERAYINAAKKWGVIGGDDDLKVFDPRGAITLDEAARIMARISSARGLDLGKTLSAALSDEAVSASSLLCEMGLLSKSDGTEPLSRAAAAELLFALSCAK